MGIATVLVPTDLGAASKRATALACELACALPALHVTLLRVVEDAAGPAVDVDRATLDADLPPDLAGRVAAQVRRGPAIATIVGCAEEMRPAFVVMGAHARDVVRSWLTRDTTAAVVHAVRCPVWIVPAR